MHIWVWGGYRNITDEELERYRDVLEQMDSYPGYSSIEVVDGTMVIVKLEELE